MCRYRGNAGCGARVYSSLSLCSLRFFVPIFAVLFFAISTVIVLFVYFLFHYCCCRCPLHLTSFVFPVYWLCSCFRENMLLAPHRCVVTSWVQAAVTSKGIRTCTAAQKGDTYLSATPTSGSLSLRFPSSAPSVMSLHGKSDNQTTKEERTLASARAVHRCGFCTSENQLVGNEMRASGWQKMGEPLSCVPFAVLVLLHRALFFETSWPTPIFIDSTSVFF